MKPVAKIFASFISAAVLGAAGSAIAAAPDLEKGKATMGGTCVACHGADGNSTIAANPVLAQQHPEYLMRQLRDFKSSTRKNATMNGMAAGLSDDDMRNVSYFLASQKANKGAATNKDSIALGEKIWRGGIASRAVPACAACHSPNGAGIPSVYPRLAGQHADYTAQTLKDFRDGVRTNNKVMVEVTKGMNDAQIKAVADFIQGLH